ncbi:hypothetical protein GGI21_004949, partial [Coemansia aciculifera]
MAAARASSSRLGHGRTFAGEQLPFVGFTYSPVSVSPSSEKADATILRLRARVAHLEAAQKDWDAERRRLVAECAALEARLVSPPQPEAQLAPIPEPRPVPSLRDASVQTDPAAPRLSGIATLVVNGAAESPKPSIEHRRSLAPISRAERRVSAGVASDALSVVSTKCDRLAACLDTQATDLAAIHTAVLSVCSALATASAATDGVASPDGDSRRSISRRKSERRRGAIETLPQPPQPDNTHALDLCKALADDLVLALRAQLADTEQQRAAAEARAAELLAWIGRESKGRALLEDMIRTAQHACKLAEEKFDAMQRDADLLKATVTSRDEEIASMQATVETRDKELRHLRRASRKALDQLADLKNAPLPPPVPVPTPPTTADPAMQKSIHALELELQEAAAVHVRQQFEIARLEGEISRLESEKSLVTKDLALKERRLRDAEAKARQTADSDGIRVRAMDPPAGETNADDDADGS